jgi:alpha-tubulin suppressor-like RCC1 family protein
MTLDGRILACLLGLSLQALPQVVKVAGDKHKLILRADGTVAGWGTFLVGQLGPIAAIKPSRNQASHLVAIELPAKAIDIAAGEETSYALLADGSVMAWGGNSNGQLGLGPGTKLPLLASSTTAFEYRGMERPARIPTLSRVKSIAAAGYGAFAVLDDGTVRAWGAGPTGNGKSENAPTPVEVANLKDVVSLSTSGHHVLAVTQAGRVFSWGSNYYGALGRPPRQEQPMNTAEEAPGLSDVMIAVAGAGVSTAVKRDGTVWVWGANWQSQFGFGVRSDPPGLNRGYNLTPQQVPGLTGVKAIALGLTGRHTLALMNDGTVRFWGNSDWGQGGTGAGPGFQPRPVAIKISGVKALFACGNNSFAVRNDGSLWAWGSGDPGTWPLKSNTRLPAPLSLE